MKVRELRDNLIEMPPDADVYFDTEGQCYGCHYVTVDKVYAEVHPSDGHPIVTLHEDAPHRSGHQAW